MKPVVFSTDLDVPPEPVFAFISEFPNNPRWQKGMVSCRWTSPPPRGVGSTYDQVATFLNKEIVSSFVVQEHEPGRRVKITTTRSPFPITETRIVEPRAGGSRVTVILEGDASGFFGMGSSLLRPMVARSVRGDYGQRLPAALSALSEVTDGSR